MAGQGVNRVEDRQDVVITLKDLDDQHCLKDSARLANVKGDVIIHNEVGAIVVDGPVNIEGSLRASGTAYIEVAGDLVVSNDVRISPRYKDQGYIDIVSAGIENPVGLKVAGSVDVGGHMAVKGSTEVGGNMKVNDYSGNGYVCAFGDILAKGAFMPAGPVAFGGTFIGLGKVETGYTTYQNCENTGEIITGQSARFFTNRAKHDIERGIFDRAAGPDRAWEMNCLNERTQYVTEEQASDPSLRRPIGPIELFVGIEDQQQFETRAASLSAPVQFDGKRGCYTIEPAALNPDINRVLVNAYCVGSRGHDRWERSAPIKSDLGLIGRADSAGTAKPKRAGMSADVLGFMDTLDREMAHARHYDLSAEQRRNVPRDEVARLKADIVPAAPTRYRNGDVVDFKGETNRVRAIEAAMASIDLGKRWGDGAKAQVYEPSLKVYVSEASAKRVNEWIASVDDDKAPKVVLTDIEKFIVANFNARDSSGGRNASGDLQKGVSYYNVAQLRDNVAKKPKHARAATAALVATIAESRRISGHYARLRMDQNQSQARSGQGWNEGAWR